MKFDPKIHHRHSIRLPGYDYSRPGAYIVTFVTHGRECILGEIVDGKTILSPFGQIVRDAWFDLPCHYPHVRLDAFCIMPDHVHAIIVLVDDSRRGGSMEGPDDLQDVPVEGSRLITNRPRPAPTIRAGETRPYKSRHALPEIVRALKSFSARRINRMRGCEGVSVWQRNYYEHIIRDDREWDAIRQYILDNPANWEQDQDNPGDYYATTT